MARGTDRAGRYTYSLKKLYIFMGSKQIVSDQDVKLLSHFWHVLLGKLGTILLFSTPCHQ